MTHHIESLLHQASIELQALEMARQRYAKQLAPNFSIFNYIYTDEMMLSRIIADLLNPQGDHAQGSTFLKLFISQFISENLVYVLDLDNAHVQTEVQTHRVGLQRRMDIYINLQYKFSKKTFGICIENKPFAADQKDQLKDYASELEKRHPSNNSKETYWHLIYLNGFGNEPNESSISTGTLQQWKDNQKFTSVEYPQLIHWLDECTSLCKNPRVTTFLQAFSQYISQTFLGIQDMSESKYIVDLILKDEKSLEAAFCIEHQLHVAKSNLMQTLNQQLTQLCGARNWTFKDSNLTESNAYSGFEIEYTYRFDNIGFGLEFQKSGYRMPLLGIWMNDINLANPALNEQIRHTLSDLFIEKTTNSKKWPFCIQLQLNEIEMWLNIQNGQFAMNLINYFSKIESALKKIHLHSNEEL